MPVVYFTVHYLISNFLDQVVSTPHLRLSPHRHKISLRIKSMPPGRGKGWGQRLAGIEWFVFKGPEYFLEGSIYENHFFNTLKQKNHAPRGVHGKAIQQVRVLLHLRYL